MHAQNARSVSGATLIKEQVAQAVGDGADLDEVAESVIYPARLDPEQRDALWLYAWGLLEREHDLAEPPAGQRFAR